MLEADLQTAIVRDLRRRGYLVAAIPNASRGPVQWRIAQARTGLLPGAPDLIVFLAGGKGVALEIKTDTGRVSSAQAIVHDRLRELGWSVHVVRSVSDAVLAVARG